MLADEVGSTFGTLVGIFRGSLSPQGLIAPGGPHTVGILAFVVALRFLASTWAHVLWALQRLNYTPLRLLHALIPSPVSIHSHHEGAVDDAMSITVAQDICRAKRS